MKVHTYAPGPPEHGVVRHAHAVARLCAQHGVTDTSHLPALTHAHFTDALFGRTVEEAARNYQAWAAGTAGPLVVTAHDVPDPTSRARREVARCAGYAAVLRTCAGVIVSAEHEARKVAVLTDRPVRRIALPLPPEPATAAVTGIAAGSALVVLGYVYPGKGHREAIDIAAAVGEDRPEGPPPVVAAGSVSAGHTALSRELRAHAAACGVPFEVTGQLPDDVFTAVARVAAVPLALNRTVSASGSLLSWLSCRRRPVTWHGPYSAEIAARHPDALILGHDIGDLVTQTSNALRDPALTWLPRRLEWSDTGAEHVDFYRATLSRPPRAERATPAAGAPC